LGYNDDEIFQPNTRLPARRKHIHVETFVATPYVEAFILPICHEPGESITAGVIFICATKPALLRTRNSDP